MLYWVLTALAAAAGLLWWGRDRPQRGLYATIFATGFLMAPELPVVREKLAAPEICMVVTWLLILFRTRRATAPFLECQKRVLIIGSIFVACYFFSFAINSATIQHGFVGSSVEVINYAYGFSIMLTVAFLVDRWEVLVNCLWAWLISALVVGVVGVSTVVGLAPDWAYDDFSGRVSATLKFENQVPSFILPILPVAVVFLVVRPQYLKRRLFLVVTLVAGLGTIAMTGSRTGLIMAGLFLAGIVWIAVAEANKPRLNSSLITASLGILVALQLGISGLAMLTYEGEYALGKTPAWQRPTVTLMEWLAESDGSLDDLHHSRANQIDFVFDKFVDHSVVGVGPKMLGPRFGAAEVHNTYLGVLIEAGILSFIVFFIFLALVFQLGSQSIQTCQSDVTRAIIGALIIGFALLLFYQLTMFGLRQRNIWIIMGLIIALPRALNVYSVRSQIPALHQGRRVSRSGSRPSLF